MFDMVVNRQIGGVSSWVVVAESRLRVQPMSSPYLVPTPASFGLVHNPWVFSRHRRTPADKTIYGAVLNL